MKSAILFTCFVFLATGNDETCKANGNSCGAPEDEVNLMQVRTQVHKRGAAHSYTYRKTRAALQYFKHWSSGKIKSHMRRLLPDSFHKVALGGTNSTLRKGRATRRMTSSSRVVEFLQMHRLRKCPELPSFNAGQYLIHDSSIDGSGVEHFVLRSSKGSLQYVAKHLHRLVAADPEICPRGALLQKGRQNGKGLTSGGHEHPKGVDLEDPEKGGGGSNLDPQTDTLVQDCEELFHRTAQENCQGMDFNITVLNAVERVIDGIAVDMAIEVTRNGKSEMHDVSCDFEVPGDNIDAELLQQLKKDGPEDGLPKTESASGGPGLDEELPEEKKGLVAAIAMEVDICESDAVSTMSELDIKFFQQQKTRPSGELSRYKGFEHVNDGLPDVTTQVLTQFSKSANSFDLRVEYSGCYLDSYKEPVRDQGQCGSCWAFASSSATMNNLCASADANSQVMKAAADRYEVSVQQILSCNSEQVGCNGGFASAADDAFRSSGISAEASSPYACGGGDPLNHFDASSTSCSAFPWGGTCTSSLSNDGWVWGGAFSVSGATAMATLISQGHSLYVTFDVYNNFMTHGSGIYSETTGGIKGGHAVTAVGYGTESGTDYWVLQNSWGDDWAVNGYCKFKKGSNLAGIEDDAYYMRAWVSEATTAPPCLEGDSGLVGGSGPIPCSGIMGGAYGDLCTDSGWGQQMRRACPITCGSCPGGPTGTAAGPAPTPAPTPTTTAGPTPPTTTPAPAPTGCTDSSTYVDPYFGDSCAGWASFQCRGPSISWSADLEANCPVACNMCNPSAKSSCQDDPSYTDPAFGDSCSGWAGFVCDGFSFSADLIAACPQSCNVC